MDDLTVNDLGAKLNIAAVIANDRMTDNAGGHFLYEDDSLPLGVQIPTRLATSWIDDFDANLGAMLALTVKDVARPETSCSRNTSMRCACRSSNFLCLAESAYGLVPLAAAIAAMLL